MTRFKSLSKIERIETLSILATAIENGLREHELVTIAERYIYNAFGKRAGISELAGLAFEAERKA